MTPEELAALQQILAAQSATAPVPAPIVAPRPPVDVARPYSNQAAQYNSQAGDLEKQAAVPYPQPQGWKENIVAGMRAGLQDFGRWSVPGGSTGQEALQQKRFDEENKSRIDRAKELRNQAADQQKMGQTATYQAGELQHQQEQLDQQKKFQGDEIANQQATEKRLQQTADNPVRVSVAPGAKEQSLDVHTGMPIPGTQIINPKDATTKPWHYQELQVEGKPEVWAVDPESGTPDHKVGDARPPAPVGGANAGMQVVQSTDPSGKSVYARVKVAGPEGPIQIDNKPLQNATEGNANARAGTAATVDLASAERMLNTMTATLQRIKSGQSKAPGADDMVLLSNHLAMTFGGVKGARTGKDLIEAHLKARSLPDTLAAAAERVLTGGQLTPGQREEFVNLAQRNVEAIRQKRADLQDYFAGDMPPIPAAAAGAPAATGQWKVKR